MIGKPVSLQHYIKVYLSLEHQCHKLCAQFSVALCGQGKEEQCPQSLRESHRWWLSLTGHWTSWYQLSLMIQVFTLTSSVQLARLCCWVYFDTSPVWARGDSNICTQLTSLDSNIVQWIRRSGQSSARAATKISWAALLGQWWALPD